MEKTIPKSIKINHVDDQLYGCSILLHRKSYIASSPKLLKRFDGLNFKQYMKWKWYFRYLTARYQVQYPRKFIELKPFKYPHIDPQKAELIKLKNRLRSAKAKVTEWTRKIEKAKTNHKELFPIESNPFYIKASKKIETKKALVIELEQQIAQF